MYKAAEALTDFFSGFDLPAYAEGTVPEDEVMPYITFSISAPEWNQKASMYARIWYRTRSNTKLIMKADQITAAIGERKKITHDGGYLVIWPETPKVQIQVDGDVRYAYINLSANYYNLPGV